MSAHNTSYTIEIMRDLLTMKEQLIQVIDRIGTTTIEKKKCKRNAKPVSHKARKKTSNQK